MSEQIYLLSAVNEIRINDFLKEAEQDRLATEAKINSVHLNWMQRLLRFVGL